MSTKGSRPRVSTCQPSTCRFSKGVRLAAMTSAGQARIALQPRSILLMTPTSHPESMEAGTIFSDESGASLGLRLANATLLKLEELWLLVLVPDFASRWEQFRGTCTSSWSQ